MTPGTYSLTAAATDSSGTLVTSAPVIVPGTATRPNHRSLSPVTNSSLNVCQSEDAGTCQSWLPT